MNDETSPISGQAPSAGETPENAAPDKSIMKSAQAGNAYDPVEPSFREIPKPAEQPQTDYYTTGTQPKKWRNSQVTLLLIGLVACLATLAVLLITNLLYSDRETGIPAATATVAENVLPTVSVNQPDITTREVDILPLLPATEPLSNEAVYERIMKSTMIVVAVEDGVEEVSTGVVLSRDGYVLAHTDFTTYADDIYVITPDGERFDASLVGTDPPTQLVVLKIEAHDLVPAELGESEELRPGQAVLAIGNPFGQEMPGTMQTGMISAVTPDVNNGSLSMTLLQTDIPLLSLNTGGLLINQCGQVIGLGITSAGGYVAADSAADVGFVMPIHEAKSVIMDLIHYGCVAGRATLGLEISEMTAPQRLYWNLPQGIVIEHVTPGSNAYAAGLQAGDVLLTIDGVKMKRAADYVIILNSYQAGDIVKITLYRAGKYYYTAVPLDETLPSE